MKHPLSGFVSLALLAGWACAPCRLPAEEAKVPDGFVIQKLEPLGGEVLRPKDWHYYAAVQNGTLAYKITKEPITKTSASETDLTINVIPGVKKKTGQATTGYPAYYFKKTKAHSEIVSQEPTTQQGDFFRFAFVADEELTINGRKKSPPHQLRLLRQRPAGPAGRFRLRLPA